MAERVNAKRFRIWLLERLSGVSVEGNFFEAVFLLGIVEVEARHHRDAEREEIGLAAA